MKKIYIAGFDTSLPGVQPLVSKYKDVCAERDYIALFSATGEQLIAKNGRPFATPLEEARAIFQANLRMINSADAIIANLDYGENYYASSDTIFEIGYAYSKGKQIVGYVNHEYVAIYHAHHAHISKCYTSSFIGRPINLMVACATQVIFQGCFEDCLDYIYDPRHDNEECKIYTIEHHA